MSRSKWLAALLLLSASASCGGSAKMDSSNEAPSGGSSATQGGSSSAEAGSSASGGTSGSAGAGPVSTQCPVTPPIAGGACNYTGNQCNYPIDMCTTELFECSLGHWSQIAPSDGAALTCFNYGPDQLGIPLDGASCACQGMLDCSFDECSTTGKVHAVCDNAVWHVTTAPCANKPCGTTGLVCAEGEVCVLPGGLGATDTCKPDPCAAQSETTSCLCASSLCGASELCSVASGVVQCECPTC
jgi:hypothetical protein